MIRWIKENLKKNLRMVKWWNKYVPEIIVGWFKDGEIQERYGTDKIWFRDLINYELPRLKCENQWKSGVGPWKFHFH